MVSRWRSSFTKVTATALLRFPSGEGCPLTGNYGVQLKPGLPGRLNEFVPLRWETHRGFVADQPAPPSLPAARPTASCMSAAM
jgi:hypothetical protein